MDDLPTSMRPSAGRDAVALLSSNLNPNSSQSYCYEVTSEYDLVHLLRLRTEVPFLMLSCTFNEIVFNKNDHRVSQFFQAFGPTLIKLQIKNSRFSSTVLTNFFKSYGNNLVSFVMNFWQAYPDGCMCFPSIEDGIPVKLLKLGILKLYGKGMEYNPRLEEISAACPNLLQLYVDTAMDFRCKCGSHNTCLTESFHQLEVLELSAYSLSLITEDHLDGITRMGLKSLKSLYLIGVSSINSDKKLNFLLESLGSTLEHFALQMGNDSCARNSCYPQGHRTFAQNRVGPGGQKRVLRYGTNYMETQDVLFSAFPIRLPKLKSFITNVDFGHELKLFESLPKMSQFNCKGTLQRILGGSFPELRHLELRQCDDSLLFDIYRSFENLQELIISDGLMISDFGITGIRTEEQHDTIPGSVFLVDFSSTPRNESSRSIQSLKNLQKFWAHLSDNITDEAVIHGFSKCTLLEELCLSHTAITTDSLKIIKDNLTSLKELQIRQCVNIPYLDVIKIFYKSKVPGERKISIRFC